MKSIQILAVLLCFSYSLLAQSNLDEAKKQVEMGKQILNNGNTKEAAKVFDSAIRASKAKPYKEGHPDIYILIGDIYLNSNVENHIEQALHHYTRARDIEPKTKSYLEKINDPKIQKYYKEQKAKEE